jgi:hypothetical protein
MSKHEDRPIDLTPLDPQAGDPGYWDRFHGEVMDRARMPLARRRRDADVHVPELLFRWGRLVAPVAAAAAVLAALALFSEGPISSSGPVAVDDVLEAEFPSAELAVVLTGSGPNGAPQRDW